jgi:beta-phosphoglucomutase-like phosphatase (HAD superfamily)
MMLVRSDKVILTDVDGVLLDWACAFDTWMARHGFTLKNPNKYNVDDRYNITVHDSKWYAKVFNESAWIRKLPPFKDAIKYVRKLHQEHGYVFHAITSLSDDEYAQHLRTKNLREMFGDTVFEKYIYLDTGAPKTDVIKNYAGTGCFWIEDRIDNAQDGLDVGLEPLLMSHGHNSHYDGKIRRVHNWKEICNIIVGY